MLEFVRRIKLGDIEAGCWRIEVIEAELRGKVPSDLKDNEDLLTSAVFGLLQYVPPRIFWPEVLVRAESYRGKPFLEQCKELGAHVPDYEKLNVHFWPNHKEFGEPDILLVFSGGNQPPLCFIIEVKLWANKSGREEQDQLNRYLAAIEDSEWLGKIIEFKVPIVLPGLIYLTPRVSWLEIYDSIENAPSYLAAESRLFLLQWQDIMEVSREVFPQTGEPQRTMLGHISDFLDYRGLAYFRGFSHLPLEDINTIQTHFYNPVKPRFSGFTEMPLETTSPTDLIFYTSKRVGVFHGFTKEPFEQVIALDTIFYGGN